MADKIVASRTEAGRPIADHLIAPEWPIDCEHVVAAFNTLFADRDVGMGLGPIPWTAIRQYADYLGLRDGEFSDFTFLLRQMDDEFISIKSEEAEKRRKNG